MADTMTTLSLLVLAQEYRGDIVKNVNRMAALLKTLPVKAGEGKNIAWVPEFDGALAETYAEGADAANYGSDTQVSAILTWGLYRSNIHVSTLAMDTSASSSTPLGNRQRWAREVVLGCEKLASKINLDCYSGTGSGTSITGLDSALLDSNTYATIDRSQTANALFRGNVIDPGVLTAPTFALLRSDLATIYTASGLTPDLAFCSPAVFNKVGGIFDATRRQVQPTEFSTAKGKITLDAGFQVVEVDGTMFMKDKDATAQQIYYVNSNYVHVEYLPSEQERMLVNSGVMVTPDDGFGPVPLGFNYEMLAKTGASEKAMIRWTGNLVVERPNACGIRKNVLDS